MDGETIGTLRGILSRLVPDGIPPEQLAGLTRIDELRLDSLQILEFLLKVEKEFNIEIPEDDLDIELISDLGALARYLDGRDVEAAE
jgi:acyl carrier protein